MVSLNERDSVIAKLSTEELVCIRNFDGVFKSFGFFKWEAHQYDYEVDHKFRGKT